MESTNKPGRSHYFLYRGNNNSSRHEMKNLDAYILPRCFMLPFPNPNKNSCAAKPSETPLASGRMND